MGIIEVMVLITMCILRMIIINLPTFFIMISIQAVIYWITGISIYNEFMRFVIHDLK